MFKTKSPRSYSLTNTFMYIYAQNSFIGQDKVVKITTDFEGIKPWMMLRTEKDYLLALGDSLSFPSLYDQEEQLSAKEILETTPLLSNKCIEIIHYLVYRNYTVYRNIVPFFVGNDMEILMKKKSSSKKKPEFFQLMLWWHKYSFDNKLSSWQQLLVFPDLWTIQNFYQIHQDSLDKDTVLILSWASTSIAVAKAFRAIKNWQISTVLTTHSQLFFDRCDLKSITIFDSHKWYYKSQQDPRYRTPDVLQKMSELYWAKFEEIGLKLSYQI